MSEANGAAQTAPAQDEFSQPRGIVSLEVLKYKEELASKMGLPSPYGMSLMKDVAADMVASGYAPNHFKQNPMALYMAAMRGREMDLDPIESIMETFWAAPGGRLGMYANKMLDLMHRRGVKSKFIEESPNRCEILFTPPGGHEPYTSVFEYEEARAAGLVKADSNWVKWPSDMCRARAISRAWRALAGTFKGSANLYSKEELEDMVEPTAAEPPRDDRMGGFTVKPKAQPTTGVVNSTVEPVPPTPQTPVAQTASPAPPAQDLPAQSPAATPENTSTSGGHTGPTPMEYRIKLVMRTATKDTQYLATNDPVQSNPTSAVLQAQALANEHRQQYAVFRSKDGVEEDGPWTVCDPPLANPRLRRGGSKPQETPATAPGRPQDAPEPAASTPGTTPTTSSAPVAPQPQEQQNGQQHSSIRERMTVLLKIIDPEAKVAAKTWAVRFNQYLSEYIDCTSKELPQQTPEILDEAMTSLEWQINYDTDEFRSGPGTAGRKRGENAREIKQYCAAKWPGNADIQAIAFSISRKIGEGSKDEFADFVDKNNLDFLPHDDAVAFFETFARTRNAFHLARLASNHNLSVAKMVRDIETNRLRGVSIRDANVAAIEQAIDDYVREVRSLPAQPRQTAPPAPPPTPAPPQQEQQSLLDDGDGVDWP